MIKEKPKQKIYHKAERIRRYEKRKKRFRHNKIFQNDFKKFYREIRKEPMNFNETAKLEELKSFWSNL